MDGWMDGCMDGWMDGRVHHVMYPWNNVHHLHSVIVENGPSAWCMIWDFEVELGLCKDVATTVSDFLLLGQSQFILPPDIIQEWAG